MSEEPDEQLADRARRGSRDAFAALVARYSHRIYSLCLRMSLNRHDAEDLAQEVFLKAYQGVHRFERGRRFAPWLLTIAANACRNHRRDRRPWTDEPLEDEARAGVRGVPADAPLVALEDAAAAREALAALPSLDRLAILLRYEEALSLEETASALAMPPARAAVRIFRAKAKLRAALQRKAGHAGRRRS